MRTHTMIDSPIGVLTLVNEDDVLCGLHMEYRTHPPAPSSFGEQARLGFEQISEELSEYFAGERTEFTVPLAPHGTEFQRRVWDALLTIPYGQTRSYGEIAKQIGEPGWEAARAVGARPLSILVTVLIPEALGPVILGYTFIFVAVVDMSAQAGLFGGGGLGDFAITYGSQRYDWPVVYITVATIIVIVQAGQFLGNWLARQALRR